MQRVLNAELGGESIYMGLARSGDRGGHSKRYGCGGAAELIDDV